VQLTGVTPILNVSDVDASVAWFARLGWTRGVAVGDHGPLADGDSGARFAAVCAGAVQVFLCRDGQGLRGGAPVRDGGDDDFGATWMAWWLATAAEVDAVHARAVAAGVAVVWPPTDEPWGMRECRLMHPDGHVFRVGAPVAP